MNDVIRTEKLSKRYGHVNAVQELSLSVRKGEIYAFLGLNGAGKTTTIRMLLGMIKPSTGAAYLNGERVDAGKYHLWKSIGSLVEVPYAYSNLSVFENLEMIRRLRKITDKHATNTIISRLHLEAYRNRKANTLSLGNAQRLGLAKALLHNPPILILDEPSNGLDPAGIVEIRELLLELSKNDGVTVFISSHILGEIAKLAQRIGIIHEGRLLQEIHANELDQLRQKKLVVGANNPQELQAKLSKMGYQVKENGEHILEILDCDAVHHPDQICVDLVNANLPPMLLKVEAEDLESYFLRTIKTTGGVN